MSRHTFSEKEKAHFRQLALESILHQHATGFNYYPKSVELYLGNSIAIPVKFGHRNSIFLDLLEQSLKTEFGPGLETARFPRVVAYFWNKRYSFPSADEGTRLWSVDTKRYIETAQEYATSSKNIIAEGPECTFVVKPSKNDLIPAIQFIGKKGSFFKLNDDGDRVASCEGSHLPFEENPERLSDEAYKTPMLATSYTPELAAALPSFKPVIKLFKIKGQEEISTYLDKTQEKFETHCTVKFPGTVRRLANRLFRDFINFEEKLDDN